MIWREEAVQTWHGNANFVHRLVMYVLLCQSCEAVQRRGVAGFALCAAGCIATATPSHAGPRRRTEIDRVSWHDNHQSTDLDQCSDLADMQSEQYQVACTTSVACGCWDAFLAVSCSDSPERIDGNVCHWEIRVVDHQAILYRSPPAAADDFEFIAKRMKVIDTPGPYGAGEPGPQPGYHGPIVDDVHAIGQRLHQIEASKNATSAPTASQLQVDTSEDWWSCC